jgi:hypothetical protein
MRCQITIILYNGDERKFALTEADLADLDSGKAAEWLAEEFVSAGAVVPNRLGKILLVDKVIVLARSRAAAEFAEPTPWVKEFLRAVAVTIDRRSITIDLSKSSLILR